MQFRKLLVPVFLFAFVLSGAMVVSAQQEWFKIGEKDVNFKLDHDTIDADAKGKVREIHMRVLHAPVKFKRIVIVYKDGTKQDLEYLENLEVGRESRSITIEGDGHVISSVELWYETDTLGGKKAKVAVYGRG